MTIPFKDVLVFLLSIFLLPLLYVMSSAVLVNRLIRLGGQSFESATDNLRPAFIYPQGPLAMQMMTQQMDPVFGDHGYAK